MEREKDSVIRVCNGVTAAIGSSLALVLLYGLYEINVYPQLTCPEDTRSLTYQDTHEHLCEYGNGTRTVADIPQYPSLAVNLLIMVFMIGTFRESFYFWRKCW
jgi:hypothetical protein